MKMKNKILILIIILAGLFTAINAPVYSAEQGYQFLEKLPSFATAPSPGAGLSSYLQWLFVFAISFAGIAAVSMIIIGGIQYITAYGNPSQIENAKNRIYQALLGLLLIVSAWLILYTINPDLVKGVLKVPPIIKSV